jgi:twitching motility protein PilT
MKTLKIEKDVLDMVVTEIGKSELFRPLNHKSLVQIANVAVLNQYNPDECIVRMNDPSDTCFMIISGEVAILQHSQPDDEMVELARRKPYDVIGEIGLLLNQPRGHTVQAVKETLLLMFSKSVFDYMYEKIPGFGRNISRSLASRLREPSKRSFLPTYDKDSDLPPPEVIRMLPMDFIIRHGILPLDVEGNFLRIGCVHDPKVSDFKTLQRFLLSMQLKLVHIDKEIFDKILRSQARIEEWSAPAEKSKKTKKVIENKMVPRLDPLLKRMVAEGASDLHICAGRVPRWRIDGEIQAIQDIKDLKSEEVLDLLNPVMDEQDKLTFKNKNDTDLVYVLPGVARFRINLFRDSRGIGAAIRVIPSTILSIEQLGLPSALKKFCEKPRGLVLVTGSAGCGKSTTLAAMIDYINKTRQAHIITIEDLIEFVHQEELALINQRQVGHHTENYISALRAALREDPDVLLVGEELQNRETVSLALQAANTGSLVLGTLYTTTAISTVTRIIDLFPPDQQDHMRSNLADCLQGVVSQRLCKRIGGGRVVASEVLIVNYAVSHLIRENKIHQILSAMQAGSAEGHRLLNEDLAHLVKQRKVEYKEALSKTLDPKDLAKRVGKPLPKD